jgi:hypothetical protein
MYFSSLTCVLHVPPNASFSFLHPSNLWWRVESMSLLNMQSSPSTCYFLPLTSIDSPQHPVKSHQSVFLMVRDQVLHPYETTGKTIVLYILILRFLYSKREDKTLYTEISRYILIYSVSFTFHELGTLTLWIQNGHQKLWILLDILFGLPVWGIGISKGLCLHSTKLRHRKSGHTSMLRAGPEPTIPVY